MINIRAKAVKNRSNLAPHTFPAKAILTLLPYCGTLALGEPVTYTHYNTQSPQTLIPLYDIDTVVQKAVENRSNLTPHTFPAEAILTLLPYCGTPALGEPARESVKS